MLVSRDELNNALQSFTCMRDRAIERFVRNEAVEFSEEFYGSTYAFLGNDAWSRDMLSILGIFTLAIAVADFRGLSKAQLKKIFGHKTRGKSGPHRGAWLLGQFARSDGVSSEELPGKEMYSRVLDVLRELREASSGRVLILECASELQPVYESYDLKVLPKPAGDSGELITMYTIPEPKRSPLYQS